MFKLEVLDNKIKYILAPLSDTQAITVLVLVKVGSRYEPLKLNGVSHFIEHLLFKGTKKRPKSLDISKELDGIGADYNAFTSKQHTGYYIKASKQHLALALEMLSDLLFNSLFEAREIERERGVIIEEINMYEDNPLINIGNLFEGTIFSPHPLGRNISGPKENVKRIKRAELVKFFKDYYQSNRLIIGLAGNFDQAKAAGLIKRYFGRRQVNQTKDSFKKFSVKQKAPRLKFQKKATQQVQLALGFPAYRNTSPKVYALTLLSVILGGGMSSRLFTEVREKKGLCYFIRTSASLYEDTGNFLIQAGLDQKRLPEAVATIKTELVKARRQGVSGAELKRAKEFLKGRLVLQLEDSADLISWLAEQEMLLGKTEDLAAKIKKIEAVTLKEIKKTAEEIIKFKKVNLALIGPEINRRQLLNILK